MSPKYATLLAQSKVSQPKKTPQTQNKQQTHQNNQTHTFKHKPLTYHIN